MAALRIGMSGITGHISSRSKYAVAGIYPYDNPKYAIVVMTEKGKSGSEDCCPIFRTIVDELEKI